MYVPAYIMDRYSDVTLYVDIMHVQWGFILCGHSRPHQDVSIIPIRKWSYGAMLSCIDKIKAAYDHRGFAVKNIFMDNTFKCPRDDPRENGRNIELNSVAVDEHEPHIERYI